MSVDKIRYLDHVSHQPCDKILIKIKDLQTAMSLTNQVAVSASPTQTTIHDRFSRHYDASQPIRQPKVLQSIENEGLRLLLLENISQDAVNAFKAEGFHVDHYTKAMSEDELVDKIGSYHCIGIRSKTKITARVIKAASKVCEIAQTFNPSYIVLAPRHWMLLHRRKSSRSSHRRTYRHTGLQLAILQLTLSCGVGYGRTRCALSSAL